MKNETNDYASKSGRMPENGREGRFLLDSFQLKSLNLRNRVVLPPMDLYSADETGIPNEVHFVHYTARAIGGVGLIIMEATAVTPNGRISDNCLGLWRDDQALAIKPIVENCQKHGAKIAVQLNHAGRKCMAKKEPVIVAPSAEQFSDEYLVPAALSREEIKTIVGEFKQAAKRAAGIGFDALEIHGAHGYLISEFLSPLTNKRTDEYGGSLENRTRFLREVLLGVREVWPIEKPLLLRVSAYDYLADGMQPEEMVQVINSVRELVDIADVSSGGVAVAPISSYPGYQVPFSELIRRECKIPTITVGLLTDGHMAEEIIANGRADLVAMGRELFRNPHFVLQYARSQGMNYPWPTFYKEAFQARK